MALIKCRECGKDVSSEAVACPSCGLPVTDSNKKTGPTANYGGILLFIPVVATALIWFWVGNMALIQMPGSTLSFIGIATILSTAIIATMEAGKLGMKTDTKAGTSSPTQWFVLIILLWVVGYPYYLFKRQHYGLKSYFLVGLIVAAAFAFSWYSMSSAIEEKKSEIRNSFEKMKGEFNSYTPPTQDEILQQTADRMKQIYDEAAIDAITKYNMAKTQSNNSELCVLAMQVTGALLQAKDQSNYNEWKKTEKRNCAAAGRSSD